MYTTSYDADIAEAWGSARLVYRAVHDTEEDKDFLFGTLLGDAAGKAMMSNGLLAPLGIPRGPDALDQYRKYLLFAYMCLRPGGDDDDRVGTPATAGAGGDGTTARKKHLPPIGLICLSYERGGPAAAHHRNATLGISIAKGFRGKGYGGEAINWCLDWGFRHAALHRIGLFVWEYNANGLKLYRKLGFREEGREREALLFDRKWYDIIIMGMLEGEWENLRRGLG